MLRKRKENRIPLAEGMRLSFRRPSPFTNSFRRGKTNLSRAPEYDDRKSEETGRSGKIAKKRLGVADVIKYHTGNIGIYDVTGTAHPDDCGGQFFACRDIDGFPKT